MCLKSTDPSLMLPLPLDCDVAYSFVDDSGADVTNGVEGDDGEVAIVRVAARALVTGPPGITSPASGVDEGT